jgi:hypothetical protein
MGVMTAQTADWVALLDEQLIELADGDETAIGWLAVAWEWLNTPIADQPRVAVRAYTHLSGRFSQQHTVFHDLTDAVEQWLRWDLLADGQGNHRELSLKSREGVCDDVVWALQALMRRAA